MESMGRLKVWWNRLRRKTYEIAVLMRSDGFIPLAQFQGNNLETTLEAAAWSYSCITANAEAASSLTPIVQIELRKKGIDIYSKDPAMLRRMFAEINTNYPYCKVTDKTHV